MDDETEPMDEHPHAAMGEHGAAHDDEGMPEEHDELEPADAEHDGDEDIGAAGADAPGKPLEMGHVADVIALMSRAVGRLSELPAVRSEDLGLAEWLSLRQIAAGSGMRAGQLSGALGVTRQRGNHIAKALKDAKLITSGSVEGSKSTMLTVTDAGREKAARVDAAVLAVFSTKLEGKAGPMGQLKKRLSQLSKALPSAKVEKGAGKDAKAAKAAAKAAKAARPKKAKAPKAAKAKAAKGPKPAKMKAKGKKKGKAAAAADDTQA